MKVKLAAEKEKLFLTPSNLHVRQPQKDNKSPIMTLTHHKIEIAIVLHTEEMAVAT